MKAATGEKEKLMRNKYIVNFEDKILQGGRIVTSSSPIRNLFKIYEVIKVDFLFLENVL